MLPARPITPTAAMPIAALPMISAPWTIARLPMPLISSGQEKETYSDSVARSKRQRSL